MKEWLEKCQAEGKEPFLEWYSELEREPEDKELPISFGLMNQIEDDFMPELAICQLVAENMENFKAISISSK